MKDHEINLLLATLAVIGLIGALLFLNRDEVVKTEEQEDVGTQMLEDTTEIKRTYLNDDAEPRSVSRKAVTALGDEIAALQTELKAAGSIVERQAKVIKHLTDRLSGRDNEIAALQAEIIFRNNSIVKDTRLEYWAKVTTEEKERLMIKYFGVAEFPIKGIDLDKIYRAEHS